MNTSDTPSLPYRKSIFYAKKMPDEYYCQAPIFPIALILLHEAIMQHGHRFRHTRNKLLSVYFLRCHPPDFRDMTTRKLTRVKDGQHLEMLHHSIRCEVIGLNLPMWRVDNCPSPRIPRHDPHFEHLGLEVKHIQHFQFITQQIPMIRIHRIKRPTKQQHRPILTEKKNPPVMCSNRQRLRLRLILHFSFP